MSFDPKILDGLLQCTRSASPLLHHGDGLICVDPQCRLEFAIRDDIPVMLVDEAQQLSLPDWSRIMQSHGRDAHTGALAGAHS